MEVCHEVPNTMWPTSRGASSATPTCAAFSAPTSFVPSPHISVAQPAARSTRNTASFCSGDTLANTCKLQTTMLERCHNPTTSRSNYMNAAASTADRRLHDHVHTFCTYHNKESTCFVSSYQMLKLIQQSTFCMIACCQMLQVR